MSFLKMESKKAQCVKKTICKNDPRFAMSPSANLFQVLLDIMKISIQENTKLSKAVKKQKNTKETLQPGDLAILFKEPKKNLNQKK